MTDPKLDLIGEAMADALLRTTAMNAFLNALDRDGNAALTAGEILRADLRRVLLRMLASSGDDTRGGAAALRGMNDGQWQALVQQMIGARREANPRPQTTEEADQESLFAQIDLLWAIAGAGER